MVAPAMTGSGLSVFVTDRSADAGPTVVVAVALSFPGVGSVVAEPVTAVLVTVELGASEPSVFTTSVNTELPGVRINAEQETVPVPPTAGVVHDQPPGLVSETNVVPVGMVSLSVADVALLGPP